MLSKEKKEEMKKQIDELLDEAKNNIIEKIDLVEKSGMIDLSGNIGETGNYVLSKLIISCYFREKPFEPRSGTKYAKILNDMERI